MGSLEIFVGVITAQKNELFCEFHRYLTTVHKIKDVFYSVSGFFKIGEEI